MCLESYQDYSLHFKLRQMIYSSKYNYPLRTLANCGCTTDISNGVHVLSNGEQVKILGTRFCNNSWGCPACTARKMAKFSSRVSCAIDALAQQKKVAVMVTYTVFHTKKHSLDQVLELLTRCWNSMNKNAYWKRKKKDGTYYTKGGTYSNFLSEFSIKHTIRATEITYGEHGWHPHLHVLYFIDKEKLTAFKDWEDELTKEWRKLEDKFASQIFTEKSFQVRKMLSERHDKKSTHHGVYISKDDNNETLQIKSGDYICGWGGNNELTGGNNNLKIANEGHFTLMQMMYKAVTENDQDLFEQYCKAMMTLLKRRTHKIDFSRTGLNAIIEQYKNTEGYKEFLKKKRTNELARRNIKPYSVICWFTKQQWLNISISEKYGGHRIIPMIAKLATKKNAYELICKLMKYHNLDPPLKNSPGIDISKSYNEICGFAA